MSTSEKVGLSPTTKFKQPTIWGAIEKEAFKEVDGSAENHARGSASEL